MKNLILSVLAIFAFTLFNTTNAQETIKSQEDLLAKRSSKAKSGKDKLTANEDKSFKVISDKNTINCSDKKAKLISFNGINYYIIDGIWHTKFKNKYILKQAPKGARISFLPKNGKMVTMGGMNYYKSNGVFYKKIKGGFYEVARP